MHETTTKHLTGFVHWCDWLPQVDTYRWKVSVRQEKFRTKALHGIQFCTKRFNPMLTLSRQKTAKTQTNLKTHLSINNSSDGQIKCVERLMNQPNQCNVFVFGHGPLSVSRFKCIHTPDECTHTQHIDFIHTLWSDYSKLSRTTTVSLFALLCPYFTLFALLWLWLWLSLSLFISLHLCSFALSLRVCVLNA